MGPQYGAKIWGRNMGPQYGAKIWGQNMGPKYRAAIWGQNIGGHPLDLPLRGFKGLTP
jgi:hypothetical protein